LKTEESTSKAKTFCTDREKYCEKTGENLSILEMK